MNPQATLTFSLQSAGAVAVRLYDFAGRSVRTVVENASYGSGVHSLPIDGLDDRGHPLASGVYFYRVETPDGPIQGRVVVAR
jgi:flagellar hook assembly protein FlgD